MSDFFQNGNITTLQQLKSVSLSDIENKLRKFSQTRQVALILPAIYTEFEGNALPLILNDLKKADYLSKIILSLDSANKEEYLKVKKFLSDSEIKSKILWNNGPEITRLCQELNLKGLLPISEGKGKSVWLAMSYLLQDSSVEIIGLHDCDISNYSREFLTRLIYPVIHPDINFEFSKGYYSRLSDKLYGRATRLFFTPLIRSLKNLMPGHPFLEYLDSFRFVLSGECVLTRKIATEMQLAADWGLEVSILHQVHKLSDTQRICQVEITDFYEHKHRQINNKNNSLSLSNTVLKISLLLFYYLDQKNEIFTKDFNQSLLNLYWIHANRAIKQYKALSIFNNISYSVNQEFETIKIFYKTIDNALEQYSKSIEKMKFMKSWNSINTTNSSFLERLVNIVEIESR